MSLCRSPAFQVTVLILLLGRAPAVHTPKSMGYHFDLARALSFCCLCSDSSSKAKSRRRRERPFNPLEEDVYEPPVLLLYSARPLQVTQVQSRPLQVTQVQPRPVSMPSARDNMLSGLPPYTPRPVPVAMPPAYHPGSPTSPAARCALSAVIAECRILIQRQLS
ncbi:hypothetical protein C8Q72DRAFT_41444 [Fomitopsis betulina]|nr:hypothetical protein C8Q72DRAFT_41444 [Fomitopsis betulina]